MFTSLFPGLLGIKTAPLQSIELAAEHGFGGLDVWSQELLQLSDAEKTALRERFHQTGVRPGYVSLAPHRIPVPTEEWNAALAQWESIARTASEFGYSRAALVLLPFHETLETEVAIEEHVQRLQQGAPILADYGIRLGLEYIAAPSRRAPYAAHTIWNLAGALELLERVGCDNLGLMLDTFHWHGAGESVADLESLTNEQIVVVHINDAPAVPLEDQNVLERALPGETGVIDSEVFFSALEKVGYDGPLTCEPMPPAIERIGASNDDEVLRAVKRTLDGVNSYKGRPDAHRISRN